MYANFAVWPQWCSEGVALLMEVISHGASFIHSEFPRSRGVLRQKSLEYMNYWSTIVLINIVW